MIYIDDDGNIRTTVESESPQSPVHPQPAQPPAAQSSPANPAQEPAKDPGFLDYVTDIPKGAYNGVIGAVQETGQFAWDVLGALPGRMQDDKMPGYETMEGLKATTTTGVGKLTESVAQLGTAIVGAGKFIKTAGWLKNASAVTRATTSGAIADAVAMDPLEARLSNVVESFPQLSNPITEALAASPDDNRWVGRLKNAAEGVVVGAAFDTLLGSIKWLRAKHKGDSKGMAEAAEETEQAVTKASGDGPATIQEAGSKATPEPTTQPATSPDAPTGAEASTGSVKRTGLQPEEIDKIIKEAAQDAKPGDDLRPKLLNSLKVDPMTDEGAELLQTVYEKVYHHTNRSGGQKTLDELTAKDLMDFKNSGLDTTKVEESMSRLGSHTKASQQAQKDLFFLRCSMDTVREELARVTQKIAASGETPNDLLKQQALVRTLGDLSVAVTDGATEAGRTLVSLRQTRESFAGLLNYTGDAAAKDLLKKAVKEGRVMDLEMWKKISQDARFLELTGNPEAMKRFAEAVRSKKTSDFFMEVYMNSILSGVRTHLTNAASNAAKTALTPLTRALGHLAPGKSFNPQAAAHEAAAIFRMRRHLEATLRFTRQAFKEDKTFLEGSVSPWLEGADLTTKAWSAQNVRGRHLMSQLEKGKDIDSALQIPDLVEMEAKAVDMLGQIITAPGRLLKTCDEFFKQLNYRVEAETTYLSEAMERFGKENTDAIAEYVADKMAKSFDASGKGTNKDILEFAKLQTWTQDLPTNSVSGMVQKISNHNPFFKAVLPFVRTPSNLMYDAIDHLPFLAMTAARNREALKAGTREAALVKGRQMFGGMVMASVAFMAMDGTITGSAPTDPKLRDSLYRTGWRPNSIRVGDTYVSLNRADPLAMLITTTANFVAAAPLLEERGVMEAVAALSTSLGQLIADKSYMKSVGEIVDAAGGDERVVKRVAASLASGFIPNFFRETRQWVDPLMRDVREVDSRLINSIPGFSDNLPAKYDWLTGKPLVGGFANLYGISPINEDTVARELASLGGVYKGLPYEFNKVQLTEAQHSRYSELMGTLQMNGKTLHQSLNAVIHSQYYDSGRSGPDEDKHRSDQLNKVITAYRKAAGEALLRENPDFQAVAQADGRVKQKKPQLIKPPVIPSTKQQQASGPTPTQRKGADALAKLLE